MGKDGHTHEVGECVEDGFDCNVFDRGVKKSRMMLIVKVREGRVEEGNRCVAVSFEARTSVLPRNQC